MIEPGEYLFNPFAHRGDDNTMPWVPCIVAGNDVLISVEDDYMLLKATVPIDMQVEINGKLYANWPGWADEADADMYFKPIPPDGNRDEEL